MKILHLTVGMVATNCYIFYDENTMDGAVIDAGENAKAILKVVADEKINLKYVLLTHGHFDHILAVNEVVKTTGAKLVCHKDDLWLLDKEAMGQFKQFATNFVKTPVDIEAEDGTELKIGSLTAKYISTPGHTPGSSVIVVDDVMFTGDTLFKGECGRCDLEGGDYPTILRSLKKLYDMQGDYKVLPGHDAFTTLQAEREHNRYMREAVK